MREQQAVVENARFVRVVPNSASWWGSDFERDLGLQHVISNRALNSYSAVCCLSQKYHTKVRLAFIFIVTALRDSFEPSGNLKISSKHTTFLWNEQCFQYKSCCLCPWRGATPNTLGLCPFGVSVFQHITCSCTASPFILKDPTLGATWPLWRDTSEIM